MGLGGLFLTVKLDPYAGIAIILGMLLLLAYGVGVVAPLESKKKWWAP